VKIGRVAAEKKQKAVTHVVICTNEPNFGGLILTPQYEYKHKYLGNGCDDAVGGSDGQLRSIQ